MNLNGKLVYFLLSLLIVTVGFIGKSVISHQDRFEIRLDQIMERIVCMETELKIHLRDPKHDLQNLRTP
jgi:hypothetical protein